MTAKIEVKNASYIYSPDTPFERAALDGVSCSFEAGLITGLIGHTGSGKSTLVQLLNGQMCIRDRASNVLLKIRVSVIASGIMTRSTSHASKTWGAPPIWSSCGWVKIK